MTDLVQVIPVPTDIPAAAGLDRTDYDEGFTFATTAPRTAEQWIRLILEGAPLSDRIAMRSAWTALGIIPVPPWSRDQVLGWAVLRREPDLVVLGAHGLVGLTARIVLRAVPGRVVHTMLVRCDNAVARKIWARMSAGHHRFVLNLLERAARQP